MSCLDEADEVVKEPSTEEGKCLQGVMEILEGAVEDEDWARAGKKALDKLWRWWMR